MVFENLTGGSILIYGLIALLVIYIVKKLTEKHYNLPPGPRPWPIIGNLPDPYTTPLSYKKMLLNLSKIYGDVIMFKRFGSKIVYINDYDLAHKALVHEYPIELAGRPTNGFDRLSVGNNDVFFTRNMDDSYVELRKVVMSHLRKAAEPLRMIDISYECFEAFKNQIIEHNTKTKDSPLYVEPICYWLGHNLLSLVFYNEIQDYDSKEYQETIRIINDMMDKIGDLGLYDNTPLYCFPFKNKALILEISKKLSGNILAQLKDRRDHNCYLTDAKFFIDFCLQIQEMQRDYPEKFPSLPILTDNYISNLTLDIYFAGLDAFGIGFSWTIGILALYPEIQKKIRKELEDKTINGIITVKVLDELHYVNAVVNELLRYHSLSAFSSLHRAQKDVKIGKYDIPQDTIVAVNIYGIHFDNRYWTQPEKFMPERFLNSDGHLQIPKRGFAPFGMGRRICVAERYTVKEAHTIITAELCRNFNLKWSNKNKNDFLEEDPLNTFFRHTDEFFVEFEQLN